MFETLTPYFTMLPFGAAIVIALIGLLPSIVILFQASKKSPTAAQTAFAGGAALVGAWGFINAATPLLSA